MHRFASGTLAGTALIGLTVLSTGVAQADGQHPGDAPACTVDQEGSATGSPGVQSGNVVQAPIGNCSEVGNVDVDVAPPALP